MTLHLGGFAAFGLVAARQDATADGTMKQFLLQLLGFGPKPTTTVRRRLQRSNRLLTLLGLIWFGLHLFPQVLFAYHVESEGVTVYSRKPLPPETTARVHEAMQLVANSELAIAGRSERVFVCNQPLLFAFLNPASFRAFAFAMPLTGNIFIADGDPAQNLAHSRNDQHNTRTFSTVVAHEITHGLIKHRLGFFRSFALPTWIAEGYCDYIAQESSFPEAEGLQLLAAEATIHRHPSATSSIVAW
ncbi:MAG: hypothetical protein H0T11_05985 [Chthoniobacterales bacterium]|nr:hypothetical protein [Chthoniobacterales bacterium]